MFYVLTGLCVAIVLSAAISEYFFARFMMARTRLAENEIDDLIASKLGGNKSPTEVNRLREEAAVTPIYCST